MSNLNEANGTTRWRTNDPRAERATPAVDPDAARKKADMRAALVVDGQNARAEYDARRSAVGANIARLAALRLARDAGAAVAPKKIAASKKVAPSKGRGV